MKFIKKQVLYFLIIPITFFQYNVIHSQINNISNIKMLNLETLLSQALGQNPKLAAKKPLIKAAKLKAKRVRMPNNPKFKYSNKDNEHLGQKLFKRERRYGLYQKVPFPGKLRLKKEIQLENVEFIITQETGQSLDLKVKIKKLYYDLYLNHFLQTIEKQNKDQINKLIKTNSQIKTKKALKASIKLQKLRSLLYILESEQKSLEAQIRVLANIPQSTQLGIPERIFHQQITNNKLNFEELVQLAMKHRPEIAGENALINKHKKKAKLARRNYFPDVDLEIIIQRKKDYDRYAWYAKIGFEIPLWVRQKQKRESDEQESIALAKMLKLQNIRNEIRGNIQSLTNKIQAINKSLHLYKTEILPGVEKIAKLDAYSIDSMLLLQDEKILNEKLLVKREILLAQLEREVGTSINFNI